MTAGQSLDRAYPVRLSATTCRSAAGILARLGIKAPRKHAVTLCLKRQKCTHKGLWFHVP